jgi:hypothetical protein
VQVVLKVWSNNLDHSGGCDFALVEITPDFAKVALRRIEVLREQKAFDSALEETYYWDSATQFFSPWAIGTGQTENAKAAYLKVEEELESLQIDRHEVAFATADFSVPESLVARVECMRMVVRADGIAFTAIPKHTDLHVTSAEIPKEFLEQSVTPANG